MVHTFAEKISSATVSGSRWQTQRRSNSFRKSSKDILAEQFHTQTRLRELSTKTSAPYTFKPDMVSFCMFLTFKSIYCPIFCLLSDTIVCLFQNYWNQKNWQIPNSNVTLGGQTGLNYNIWDLKETGIFIQFKIHHWHGDAHLEAIPCTSSASSSLCSSITHQSAIVVKNVFVIKII